MAINKIEIKKIRNKLELTQAELGKILGVTKTTVSNWETGKHPMGLSDEKVLRQLLSRKQTAEYNETPNWMTDTEKDLVSGRAIDTDPQHQRENSNDLSEVLRELLREKEKRLQEKDEFIEYLKRENDDLRARLSESGSSKVV